MTLALMQVSVAIIVLGVLFGLATGFFLLARFTVLSVRQRSHATAALGFFASSLFLSMFVFVLALYLHKGGVA